MIAPSLAIESIYPQLPHSTILFPVHRGIASADKGKTPSLNFLRSVQNFDERARTFHPCLRSTWLILLSPLCAASLLVSKRGGKEGRGERCSLMRAQRIVTGWAVRAGPRVNHPITMINRF